MARTVFFLHILLGALLLALPSHSSEQPFKEGISESNFIQLAQRGGGGMPDPGTLIKRMDKDGDGRVAKAEFLGPPQAFGRIDADQDGYLTVEEFTVALANRGGRAQSESPIRNTPGLYFVDAHSQMDHKVSEKQIMSLMDSSGVYRTILSNHLRRPWRDIISFAGASKNRIVPAVRIKGHLASNNTGKYLDTLRDQMGEKRFRAMAEMLIYHDGFKKYPKIIMNVDDHRVRAALDGARKKGWPFIAHLEFAFMSVNDQKKYMKGLETFLQRNPDQPIVMIHMGRMVPAEVGRLLDTYPNVYFMMSSSSNLLTFFRKYPELILFDGPGSGIRFKEPWKRLVLKHPSRLIFALDIVFSQFWVENFYFRIMNTWWRSLAELPDEVAHMVAHGNAERLWKLVPKPASVTMSPPPRVGGPGGGADNPDPSTSIKKMDKDGDGRVAKAEFRGPPQAFGRIDADKDGFLTVEEFTKALANRGGGNANPAGRGPGNSSAARGRPGIQRPTGQRPAGSPASGKPKSAAGGGPGQMRIRIMDQDGDGRVSKAEFRGPPQAFGRIDSNQDGYLTLQEFNQILGNRQNRR